MSIPAIEVKNISKLYHITQSGSNSDTKKIDFFALDDVSFTLNQGDVMGIIGSNGSGKSTLLKILSQITKPTSGEAHFYGTVSSILDIGSNFHPDLTGRENVKMQLKIGNINSRKFNEYYKNIKRFSEIEDFFDQPVKFYSNGMFLRLAFSIAFHIPSDILILDEVLSVGDEGFRLKCMDFLRLYARQGRTLLFVSHNRSEILEHSNRCLWLDKGKIKKMGNPSEVLGAYFIMHHDNYDGKKSVIEVDTNTNSEVDNKEGIIDAIWTREDAPGNATMAIRQISVRPAIPGDRIYHKDAINFFFTIEKKRREVHIGTFFFLQDVFYQPVLVGHFLNNSNGEDYSSQMKDEVGLFEIRCTIPPLFLVPGKYYLMLRFGMEENKWNSDSEEAFRFSEKLSFTIHPDPDYIDLIGDLSKGSVRPLLDWGVKRKD